MRTPRSWSIRAKIIALLVVPSVALVLLWVLATTATIGPALDLFSARTANGSVIVPGDALVAQLQVERRLSLVALGDATPEGLTAPDEQALRGQRAQTDSAVATFRNLAKDSGLRGSARSVIDQRLAGAIAQLDTLDTARLAVDDRSVDSSEALRRYTAVIDSIYQIYPVLVTGADADLARQTNGLLTLRRAREVLSQEDAAVRGAAAAGHLGTGGYAQLAGLIATEHYLYSSATPDLPPADQDKLATLMRTTSIVSLHDLENVITSKAHDGAAVPFDLPAWESAYDSTNTALRQFELATNDDLVAATAPRAMFVVIRLVVAGLLGLLAVAVTGYASVRLGRGLIRRLHSLRTSADELATKRLPDVVARLRRGEPVDLDTEAPDLPQPDDELGVIGHAFTVVQRAAIQSAVDEASVRHGVNEVFLNIARRSQTLLHRQLAVLDRMERRTSDPEELENLFRLDHLATRMRRHAEDLVILAGAVPGRGWRNPVPLIDVVRGAVSEVEDYARVSIRPLPTLALNGRAVADVIHLLAELIENATSFSPPTTRVFVEGSVVAHGFVIEIEDRGLGLSAAALDSANARLSEPPELDPTNTSQLGLFVVARLAARHGISVRLRPSPYGGITAVALLPMELVVGEVKEPEALREITAAPQPALALGSTAAPVPAAAVSGQVIAAPPRHAKASTARVSSPVPAQSRAEAGAREEGAAETGAGLPKRVRRGGGDGGLTPEPSGPVIEADAAIRSAEQSRSMMAALQQGTNLGRRDAGEDVAIPPETDPPGVPAAQAQAEAAGGDASQARHTGRKKSGSADK